MNADVALLGKRGIKSEKVNISPEKKVGCTTRSGIFQVGNLKTSLFSIVMVISGFPIFVGRNYCFEMNVDGLLFGILYTQ